MIVENGNIWDKRDHGFYIVVTTNIGWKSSGEAVMGKGIAAEAARRFPFLTKKYGRICKERRNETPIVVYDDVRIILLPTKPLNAEKPWLSWQNDSDLSLIERSLRQLHEFLIKKTSEKQRIKIAMPLPGCGNGNIPVRTSLKLVKKYFEKDDRVTVCDKLI